MRQGVRIPVGRGFAGRVAATGRPVIIDHVDHTTVLNPILMDKGIRSMLGVPLIAGGQVIGVLHVGYAEPRRFTSDDANLLQLAADRARGRRAVAAVRRRSDRGARRCSEACCRPRCRRCRGVQMRRPVRTGSGSSAATGTTCSSCRPGSWAWSSAMWPAPAWTAAVVMGRMRSALRAYALETTRPGRGPGPAGSQDAAFRAGRAGHRAVRGVRCPSLDRVRITSAGHLAAGVGRPGRGRAHWPTSRPACMIGVRSAAQRRVSTVKIAARRGAVPVHRRAGRAAEALSTTAWPGCAAR